MNRVPQIVIHFNDVPIDKDLREHLEGRCEHLAAEFPEATSFEIHLSGELEGARCHGHGHVTGKRTRAAAHAESANNLRHAGDQVIEKFERELRREHDKRIFGPRREAQKSRSKRSTA